MVHWSDNFKQSNKEKMTLLQNENLYEYSLVLGNRKTLSKSVLRIQINDIELSDIAHYPSVASVFFFFQFENDLFHVGVLTVSHYTFYNLSLSFLILVYDVDRQSLKQNFYSYCAHESTFL